MRRMPLLETHCRYALTTKIKIFTIYRNQTGIPNSFRLTVMAFVAFDHYNIELIKVNMSQVALTTATTKCMN